MYAIRSYYGNEEMVIFLELGKYEVINEKSSNWVKIRTSDNKIGWVFGAYLYYDLMDN